MSEARGLERDNAEARIVSKALSDETFKQALMSDPRAVISREMGVDLPRDLKINVVQETPDTYYVVLPHLTSGGAELSDTELEAVAGGKAGTMGSKTRNGSEYLAPEQ